MSNELTTSKEQQINNFIYQDRSLKTICKNKNYDFDEFVACVAYQVKNDDNLKQCTPQSILDCCIKSAQIGLKIDANGYAYLVAYKQKCSIMIGYKGYVALIKAHNPKVSAISSFVISNKDIEENRLIMEEGEKRTLIYKRNPMQDEASLNEEEIAGFLSIVYYKNGGYDYTFITKKDVNKIRNDSNNYKFAKEKSTTIWSKHYVAMGKKTAFRQLVKWCDFSGIDKLNELDNEDYDNIKNKPANTQLTKEEYEAKIKAKQEAKQKQEQEQNKVKEAEAIKPTISSKCAGYLNLIKGHIDNGNEEGLKNARSFFANKVDGLTDDELDMCRQAVEEGYNQIATKKIEEGLAKDVEIQATGKVS